MSNTHTSASHSNRKIIRGWAGAERKTETTRVTLWRGVRAGTFPAPMELGPNSIGWFEDELDEWLASRPRRTYRLAAEVGRSCHVSQK